MSISIYRLIILNICRPNRLPRGIYRLDMENGVIPPLYTLRGDAPYFDHFERIYKTLRVTPAMEAGVTNRPWSIGDLLKWAN